MGVHSALDAFGIVGCDSAGLLGLPAGFAGVACVAAVTLLQIGVCDAPDVSDVAIEEIAFDHDGGCEG